MIALLSIKPEYASRIFDGTKKFEFRRTIFKRNVTSVVVYVSAPVSKIMGEFSVEGVLHDELSSLWNQTSCNAGISEHFFYSYFTDKKKGYAIKIGQAVKYSSPVSIQDSPGLHPPQSFLYLTCPVHQKPSD